MLLFCLATATLTTILYHACIILIVRRLLSNFKDISQKREKIQSPSCPVSFWVLGQRGPKLYKPLSKTPKLKRCLPFGEQFGNMYHKP